MNTHHNNHELGWLLNGFDSITLDELNSKAEMLSRIDNKYVVDRTVMRNILPQLIEQYEILEINKDRAFTYDTRYFDDPERSAYYEHHQGLRKGFKVRIRRYADVGLCYLEVKVKGQRGMTVKHRLPYDPADIGTLPQTPGTLRLTCTPITMAKRFAMICSMRSTFGIAGSPWWPSPEGNA